MSRLRTEWKTQMAQKLENLQNSLTEKRTNRFAGDIVTDRLSKCSRESVEEQDKYSPKQTLIEKKQK